MCFFWMYRDAETGIEVQFYMGYKVLIGIIELRARKKNLRTYTPKQSHALWHPQNHNCD